MTKLIEGAVFVGTKQYDAEAYGYLFARGQDFVLAANTYSGTRTVPVDAGGTIVDLMGRTRGTTGANLTFLRRSICPTPAHERWCPRHAQSELQRQLDALGLPNAEAIPGEVTRIAKSAPTDPLMMNRLYYLIKAAKVAGAAGRAPATSTAGLASAARQSVESREGRRLLTWSTPDPRLDGAVGAGGHERRDHGLGSLAGRPGDPRHRSGRDAGVSRTSY